MLAHSKELWHLLLSAWGLLERSGALKLGVLHNSLGLGEAIY